MTPDAQTTDPLLYIQEAIAACTGALDEAAKGQVARRKQ